jgi:hypothetical protein
MQKGNQNKTNDLSNFEKIKHWYRGLPDKKRYLEFITAFLTIPVLLTVMISNILNLQQRNTPPTEVPTPTTSATSIVTPTMTPAISPTITSTLTPSPNPQCVKEVGPIEIAYPGENQAVATDPICLDIVRTGANYCSVVWQYRINGSNWSEYTDKSICMYGLNSGTKNLELRVKSIVSGTEVILRRTFVIPTPTPTVATPASTTP